MEENLCMFFIICLYMYCHWISSYQEGRIGIPLTGLNQPHICACPKSGPGFPLNIFHDFFCDQDLRLEVVVNFVDIDELLICIFISVIWDFPFQFQCLNLKIKSKLL